MTQIAVEDAKPGHVTPGSIRELQTRLLYPLFFDRNKANDAAAALRQVKMAGTLAWDSASPPDIYNDELLEHVSAFLFRGTDVGCRYLRVSNPLANALFQNSVARFVEAGNAPPVPLTLEWGAGIELFLTPQGVGLMSLALRPSRGNLDPRAAINFNYRLSRLPPKPCPRIHVCHPSDDADVWSRIPEANRQQIRTAPPADAPLAERLGVPGGTFTMCELIDALLEPLKKMGLRSIQPELSVYTVALFGPELDLDEPGALARLGPFISALAQVEESNHAGSLGATLPIANAVLNCRHWAAAGQLGAAHVVAHQPPLEPGVEHPFNAHRLSRVFYKYFIAYLLALLQRLVLHRVIDEAGSVLRARAPNAPTALAELSTELLEFGIGGHFSQVSTRDAVHRFYSVSRQGLDVQVAWDEVHRALSEIDSKYSSERESRVARDMAQNLQVVAHVQKMVEWIECFLISVYAAELVNIIFEAAKPKEAEGLFEWLHVASVILAALGGFVASFLLLKPWKSSGPHEHGGGHAG